MLTFRERLKVDTIGEKIVDYKRHLQFAELCLGNVEQASYPNEQLYFAISHLARVSELGIYLPQYETLRERPKSYDFDRSLYLRIKGLCSDTETIINELIAEEAKDVDRNYQLSATSF